MKSPFDVRSTAELAPPAPKAEPIQIIQLAFDVTMTELPLDKVRDSRKLWNHLDELRISPALSVQLAKNGFRVGVGAAESWAAIQAVMETAKPTINTQQLFAQGGAPVTIELGAAEEGEPVFTYALDNRLSGKSFDGGDKLVNLEYQLRPEQGGTVDLRLAFEIRKDLGVMTWERINGGIREVPAYNRHIFEELRPMISLRSGEYLVVGLGETADQPHLIANRFLTGQREGNRVERMIFIQPRTFNAAAQTQAQR